MTTDPVPYNLYRTYRARYLFVRVRGPRDTVTLVLFAEAITDHGSGHYGVGARGELLAVLDAVESQQLQTVDVKDHLVGLFDQPAAATADQPAEGAEGADADRTLTGLNPLLAAAETDSSRLESVAAASAAGDKRSLDGFVHAVREGLGGHEGEPGVGFGATLGPTLEKMAEELLHDDLELFWKTSELLSGKLLETADDAVRERISKLQDENHFRFVSTVYRLAAEFTDKANADSPDTRPLIEKIVTGEVFTTLGRIRGDADLGIAFVDTVFDVALPKPAGLAGKAARIGGIKGGAAVGSLVCPGIGTVVCAIVAGYVAVRLTELATAAVSAVAHGEGWSGAVEGVRRAAAEMRSSFADVFENQWLATVDGWRDHVARLCPTMPGSTAESPQRQIERASYFLHRTTAVHLFRLEIADARFQRCADHRRGDVKKRLQQQAPDWAQAHVGLAASAAQLRAGRHISALRTLAEIDLPGPPGPDAARYRMALTQAAAVVEGVRRGHAETVRTWTAEMAQDFQERARKMDAAVSRACAEQIERQHEQVVAVGREVIAAFRPAPDRQVLHWDGDPDISLDDEPDDGPDDGPDDEPGSGPDDRPTPSENQRDPAPLVGRTDRELSSAQESVAGELRPPDRARGELPRPESSRGELPPTGRAAIEPPHPDDPESPDPRESAP